MSAEEYLSYVDQIRGCRGHDIQWQTRAIGVSHRIYLDNAQELVAVLEGNSSYQSVLANYHSSVNPNTVERNFTLLHRLLHNYTAAIKSLVDHTRLIARDVLPSGALERYEERIDSEFVNDTLTAFLHCLRNYLLHIGAPPVVATINFADANAKPTAAIELALDELLEWSGWNAPSRIFIADNNESIVLLDVIAKYDAKIGAFYDWLNQHICRSCETEIRELHNLQRQLREFYDRTGFEDRGVDYKPFSAREKRNRGA